MMSSSNSKVPTSSQPSASRKRFGNMSRVKERSGVSKPLISSFGKAGAVFDEEKQYGLHPQVIKMARKSGQLNLSNKGLTQIPQKVFRLNELDEEEQKKVSVSLSFDNTDEDRWWEQVELTKLYLSSNCITNIDSLISNLTALQLLDISDNRLKTLPVEMKELRGLNKLLLSHNDLCELPNELCQLDDLKMLSIDHNSLTNLPADIGSLCMLEQLDASHNSLESLPASIGYLQRLRKVNLSDNKLSELPLEVGDLFGLVHLDLTRNDLSAVPSCMSNLPKLEELCLRQNRLSHLPALSCPNLKELYVGANRIKKLDEESLEALSGLRVLDVSDNGIEVLPDAITLLQLLHRLDLTNNYLSNLPSHLGLLQHLKVVALEGNPLRLIRRDIVQRGSTHLLKYLSSKITEPPNSYPGFADFVSERATTDEEDSIPDQYEMRNARAVTFNQGAKRIPDKVFENARLARVPTADLSHNQLTELPEKLMELGPHLVDLVASHNRLSHLPDSVGDLSNLQFVDVRNNALQHLPASVASLRHLREVNISHNRFEAVPAVLYEVATLELLFASNNKVTSIEAEGLLRLSRLACLDLTNNDITFVPPELGNMTQLRSLSLEGNAFKVPRYDMLAKGTPFVLGYLKSRIVEK